MLSMLTLFQAQLFQLAQFVYLLASRSLELMRSFTRSLQRSGSLKLFVKFQANSVESQLELTKATEPSLPAIHIFSTSTSLNI